MPYTNGGSPYVGGSDTSHAAAESMDESAASLRSLIRQYIEKQGDEGATCDEVEQVFSMKHQTASARIRELVQMGLIHDSGGRRPTRSNRQARVYVIAEAPTLGGPHRPHPKDV